MADLDYNDTDLSSNMTDLTTEATATAVASIRMTFPTTEFPMSFLTFTAACAFIIAFIGTVGNMLTIFALPLCKKLRTNATMFVINLAVAELLYCVVILPISGAQYAFLRHHPDRSLFSDFDCLFLTTIRYTLTQAELQTIVGIAFTRAIAVGCPRFYQKIDTRFITSLYIAIIWLYSFALRVPTFLGKFGTYAYNSRTMKCDMKGASTPERLRLLIVEAVVPVIFIFFLYIFIFVMVKQSTYRVARSKTPRPSTTSTSSVSDEVPPEKGRKASLKNLKRIMSDSSIKIPFQSRRSSGSLTNSRRDMRVARTIFIIFLMVLVCSVPITYIHIIDSSVRQPVRFLGLHILYWIQYCLNVIVYVLLNRQYRVAYVDFVAKLVPSFGRHKSFVFPWENHSVSSKTPAPGQNSSFRGRKDSASLDPTAGPKEYKPILDNSAANIGKSVRLSAIVEVNSSSQVVSDDVFADGPFANDNVKGLDDELAMPVYKEHVETGTNDEKKPWINEDTSRGEEKDVRL